MKAIFLSGLNPSPYLLKGREGIPFINYHKILRNSIKEGDGNASVTVGDPVPRIGVVSPEKT